MEDIKIINNKKYTILRLLGHGKGGYSYLGENDGQLFVIKMIHHEPCDYYSFGNKILAEKNDYERLLKTGIRIPEMFYIDMENEIILKQYIEGKTIYELLVEDVSVEPYIDQIRDMADKARTHNLNIDYFPTNFVVHDGLIWYIDYECNEYMDEYSFENWGIRYWSRTREFQDYLEAHDKHTV